MESSVFEVHAHPSTWDGHDVDLRVGLFTSQLLAEQTYAAWLEEPRNRYPYTGGGRWVPIIREVRLDTVLTR